MRPRLLAAVSAGLLAVVAVVVVVIRSGSDTPDPFATVYGTGVGPWITRPGWQLGYLFGDAINKSHRTLTINSVSLRGPGVGTVVKLSVMIAPLVGSKSATPGGNHVTDPPVDMAKGGCHKQALFPPTGYRMKPGGQFRLWVIIEALKPGRWSIPQQVITYTDNGATHQHAFPIRYWGTVSPTAPVHSTADPIEARCVKPEGSRYLHYYHG